MLKIVNLAQNLLLSWPERRSLLHQHSGLSISFLSGSLYASSMIMVWNAFYSFFSSSLRYFLIYLASEYLEEMITNITSPLYLLHKFARFERDTFVKYVVCSKCCKLYDLIDCTEIEILTPWPWVSRRVKKGSFNIFTRADILEPV